MVPHSTSQSYLTKKVKIASKKGLKDARGFVENIERRDK